MLKNDFFLKLILYFKKKIEMTDTIPHYYNLKLNDLIDICKQYLTTLTFLNHTLSDSQIETIINEYNTKYFGSEKLQYIYEIEDIVSKQKNSEAIKSSSKQSSKTSTKKGTTKTSKTTTKKTSATLKETQQTQEIQQSLNENESINYFEYYIKNKETYINQFHEFYASLKYILSYNNSKDIKELMSQIGSKYGWNSKCYNEYIDDEKRMIINITKPLEVEEGIYTCPRCKGKKTHHYSRQVRSADEPATTFITCADKDCQYKWKIN